jgi:ribosomal protein L37E
MRTTFDLRAEDVWLEQLASAVIAALGRRRTSSYVEILPASAQDTARTREFLFAIRRKPTAWLFLRLESPRYGTGFASSIEAGVFAPSTVAREVAQQAERYFGRAVNSSVEVDPSPHVLLLDRAKVVVFKGRRRRYRTLGVRFALAVHPQTKPPPSFVADVSVTIHLLAALVAGVRPRLPNWQPVSPRRRWFAIAGRGHAVSRFACPTCGRSLYSFDSECVDCGWPKKPERPASLWEYELSDT